MKTFFCILIMVSGFSAQAAPDSVSKAEASLNLGIGELYSSNCLDAVEPVLASITHSSLLQSYFPEARETILFNLAVYENWATEAKSNAYHGFSNKLLSQKINRSLLAHASDRILAVPVGKAIVACVGPHLNFSGTAAEQNATADAVIAKISKIRKAVR